MLTEATRQNLARKVRWADNVQSVDGVVLFSWIDVNPTDLCNRSAGSARPCVFCPRIDAKLYPNQALNMSLDLARKIGDELRDLKYEGAVTLCGFGEPLLHPHIAELVSCFGDVHLEIVTNGDRLTPVLVNDLIDAGCDFFVVSMYDDEKQVGKFRAIFDQAGCDDEMYLLRDRWHTEADDFGLKLTNRAGMVDAGRQAVVDVTRPCAYPAYALQIDWNGDVLLCPQSWDKKVKFGNLVQQSMLDVWTSKAMHKRRMQLMRDRASLSPCSGCNTGGTEHGKAHWAAWRA